MRTLKNTNELDAKTDAGERGVTSTLKRLADRLPACILELRQSEVCSIFAYLGVCLVLTHTSCLFPFWWIFPVNNPLQAYGFSLLLRWR